ncbi:mycothiol system anti-sigma-R factor [Nostocoides sp. HKS02]|uniref:mycothiol system anti-sigma-R factor n=1 Tax=Nostocoides sp. HKS02 TaxID=1813880 RepID=UPI0012B454C6|nr:mycothiol system anti-sigma-R factor [Tetrasphaera sp. HKS02]QGN57970.1 mycothiol system anti-sigma-R factor [Tetrasphaera sp. HKS02]
MTCASGPTDASSDCSEVLHRVYEYLDGEMTPDDTTKIKQHLDECGPCLKEYDLDQALKALVKRSCACEEAPFELRTQIMARITTIQVTLND